MQSTIPRAHAKKTTPNTSHESLKMTINPITRAHSSNPIDIGKTIQFTKFIKMMISTPFIFHNENCEIPFPKGHFPPNCRLGKSNGDRMIYRFDSLQGVL